MELQILKVKDITGNPLQPRESFDREKLKELAGTIEEVGILEPIIVRPKGKGHYEIISGERRWQASKIAKKGEIPAIVKDVNDAELMVEALIENVHREDLNDAEKAKSLKSIMEMEGIKSQNKLSKRVSIPVTTIGYIFDSAGIREELAGPAKEVSDFVIRESRRLPKEERKKVIEKASKEELGGRKVRQLVSTIKKAPEPIKEVLLKPESKITPEAAEKILEVDVFTDEQKEALIKEIDRRGESDKKEVEQYIQIRKKQVEKGEEEITFRDAPKYWKDQYLHIYQKVLLLKPEQVKKLDTQSRDAIIRYVEEMAANLIKWLQKVKGTKRLEIENKTIVIDMTKS